MNSTAFDADNTDRPSLLIVGASVRAAGMSASGSRIPFVAIDLFADQDLRGLPGARGVARVPTLSALAHAHRQFAPCPWMYTGGLENFPAVVERIGRERLLLGVPPAGLRRVRDPQCLDQALAEAGFPPPRLCFDRRVPRDGTWLLKPFRSSGGRQVRFAQAGELVPCARSYLQEWVPGPSGSGIFLGTSERCSLIGVTQQVLQRDVTAAADRPFQYVGSIVGPHDREGDDRFARAAWQPIGTVLWRAFGLTGLFGVDAIARVTADGHVQVVPIEVNPRYTAAVELLERAHSFPAVAAHCAACRGDCPPAPAWPSVTRWFGKAILHATQDVVVDDSFLAQVRQYNANCPDAPTIADIPAAGTYIRKGQPVVTVLASAATSAGLRETLGWQGSDGWLQRLASSLRRSS